MKEYRYVIVGGGMAGHAAVQGIREVDESSPIGIFGQETAPPYRRPSLSKDLWKGDEYESAFLDEVDDNTNLHLGERIASIDPRNHRIANTQNEEYAYEKLLLVPGGRVRRLPFDDRHIQYYRTVQDYKTLRELTGEGKEFLVIGGGFIGSEIAAALAIHDENVTMAFPERGIGGGIFPEELSVWLNDYYRKKGVNVQSGVQVTGTEEKNGRIEVYTSHPHSLSADHIVAGVGIDPDTLLAEEAGMDVADGIIVDEFLRSTATDVYAAGDAASFRNPALGMRTRVEHEDNALTMGRLAGKNMALHNNGKDAEAYNHQPMFYSDLFDLGYEAVGLLDANLETIIDWEEPYEKGIVYYLSEGRVRGVLLWNVWEKVDDARTLIAHPGPFTADKLKEWRLSMDH